MNYIIVGYDRNRAIGAGGKLTWEGRMKTDMRFVRERTTGNAIIMGRKTFDSIGFALPNRQNIVITHRPFTAQDVTVVDNLDDAYAAVEPGRDAYIFGGQQIFQLALNDESVDEVLATEMDTVIEGADTFFPGLGPEWHEISREHHDASDADAYPFDFVTYKKTT